MQDPRLNAWYRRSYPGLTPQQIVDRSIPALTRERMLQIAWRRSNANGIARFQLPLLLWPALTFAAMMIFRISMRQARVRTVHVLRCVIYSGDVIIFLNVLLGAILIVTAVRSLLGAADSFETFNVGYVIALLLTWGFFMYRFTTALRLYLRFDHPRLTMLATQILSFLTLLVLILEVFDRRWW